MSAGRAGAGEPAVVLRRVFPFTPEAVFDAWLDADGLAEWMCPGPATRAVAVELDPREGGEFLIEMDVEGHLERFSGRYVRIDRPANLVFTWRATRTENRDTEVSVTVEPHPEGALLVLEHGGLPSEESRGQHAAGWSAILAMLEEHLGGGRDRAP